MKDQPAPHIPHAVLIRAHCDEGEDFASDWWHWEQRPGRIHESATSQIGAGHLQKWREDIALVRKLGFDGLTISLSWARIQPSPEAFDEEALAHYEDVFAFARFLDLALTTILWDVALPKWFADGGGWRNPQAPKQFAHYAHTIAERLGAHCSRWIPAHQPEWWLDRSSVEQVWPSGARGWWPARPVARHMAESLVAAAGAIRAVEKDAQIGHSLRWRSVEPSDPHSPWDFRACQWATHRWNTLFLDYLQRHETTPDFLLAARGGHWRVRFSPFQFRKAFVEATEIVNQVGHAGARLAAVSQHLREAGATTPLHWLHDAPAEGEEARCAALQEVWNTVAEADTPCAGLVATPFLDGFDFLNGYAARRGLIHVDHEDLSRTPNADAYLWQEYNQRLAH